MKTKRPFSSISYNSDDFIITKLNEQLNLHNIAFWAFINHKGEQLKGKMLSSFEGVDHKHVFVLPNSQIDTMRFCQNFLEIKDDGSVDSWLPCRSSDFGNWYFYIIHDREYLEIRKPNESDKLFRYSKGDVISSDPRFLDSLINDIDRTSLLLVDGNFIKRSAMAGVPFDTFMMHYSVRPGNFVTVQKLYLYYYELGKELKSNE